MNSSKKEKVKASFKTFSVSFWTLISRVFGVLRDITTTYVLGAGIAHDIFVVMLKIPNLFRRMVAEGAFNQAFIPVLTEYKSTKSKEELKSLLDVSFTAISSLVLTLSIIFMIFAPIIVLIFAPGFYFDPLKKDLAIEILRITFPYLFFISIVAFFGSVLNSFNVFSIPAATPIAFNLSIIVGATFFTEYFQLPVLAIAWGVFIAGILQLLINLIPIIKLKLIPKFKLNFNNPGLKKIFILMLPGILSGGIIQINILVDTIFASLLKTGSPTWLYLSDRLIQLPLGIFAIAAATVILPALSSSSATNNVLEFNRKFNWAIKFIFLLGIPSSIGLYFLSYEIINILFLRGEFSELDVINTSYSLKAFCFGLVAFMTIKILNVGFFAKQDPKTPMYVALLSLFLNVGLNWLLAFKFGYGHVGLAIGSVISAIVSFIVLMFFLLKRSILVLETQSFVFLFKIIISSLGLLTFLTAIHMFSSNWIELNLLIQFISLSAIILVGSSIYFGLMFVQGLRINFFRE